MIPWLRYRHEFYRLHRLLCQFDENLLSTHVPTFGKDFPLSHNYFPRMYFLFDIRLEVRYTKCVLILIYFHLLGRYMYASFLLCHLSSMSKVPFYRCLEIILSECCLR